MPEIAKAIVPTTKNNIIFSVDGALAKSNNAILKHTTSDRTKPHIRIDLFRIINPTVTATIAIIINRILFITGTGMLHTKII